MTGRIDANLAFQAEALRLRAQRQELLASNLANGDTPGYKAVDIDFSSALRQATGSASGAGAGTGPAVLLRTSAGHIESGASPAAVGAPLLYRAPLQPSVDGNTVDMDAERARFADNALRFEAALRFINGKLKTLLSAVQG